MTGMRRSCAAVLEEMLWDHRLSVLTQASQRNWPWGQEIFGRGKLIVCKRGKTSTGVRKPCHPSSALNARTTHSELDFQRWGIPAVSEENSRSSQKKQPCYPCPGGAQEVPRRVQRQDHWRKEEEGKETFCLQPPLFSSSAIFHHLLFCSSKTKREPTVTATSRKKHRVLLNKNLLLLKQERKHCPNGSRWEQQNLSPSWQSELVLRHTRNRQSLTQPIP